MATVPNTTRIPAHHSRLSHTQCAVLCPTPAAVVPSSTRLRTALMITVMGWLEAKDCIQPGIDLIGTYALDTKVSGTTTSVVIPCAACAFPATSPRLMKSQLNA